MKKYGINADIDCISHVIYQKQIKTNVDLGQVRHKRRTGECYHLIKLF